MKSTDFWAFIDQVNQNAGKNFQAQQDTTLDNLLKLSAEEVQSFDLHLHVFANQAYTTKLWAAAEIIMKYAEDEDFFDFRTWLIAQGQEVFEKAIENPDSLADYIDFDPKGHDFEGYAYQSMLSYEMLTGSEIPEPSSGKTELEGTDWNKADLPNLLPRLFEKYSS